MEFKIYIGILFSSILVNNFVLTRFLGVCPLIGATKKISSALAMGLAVIFVMTMASFVSHVLYQYLLLPFGAVHLRTLAFLLVIAGLVRFVEMFMERSSPELHQALGIFLPLIAVNCAVLGVVLLNIDAGFVSAPRGLLRSLLQGFGGGAGFALALLLMAGIRERLELAPVPRSFRGLPITFITAGLLALAFLGFAGMK